ncbi:rab-GTPase-TBC domain-containing protein [Tuber indicum]|nr:rab-GTPase-TBC domain-containing protein [Tuber indicum]
MSSSKLPCKFTRPASPTASHCDISDDDENGYSTITNTSTGRGVGLLYSKSEAAPSKIDNIPGFVALFQHKPPPSDDPSTPPTVATTLLLAWLPESALGDAYGTYVKVDLIDAETPPRQSYLVPPPPATVCGPGTSCVGNYAFAVPVSEIYSLLIRPPNLGWWWGSVVHNTRAETARASFGPFGEGGGLFWGGDEVLSWLRRYVRVEKSEVGPSVYLVEPSQEDLLSFGSKPTIVGHVGESSTSGGARIDPLTDERSAMGFLRKGLPCFKICSEDHRVYSYSPKVPLQVRRLLKNPDVLNLQDEFGSARLYLARDALELEDSVIGEFEIIDRESGGTKLDSDGGKPVSLEEWNGWFDPKTGKLAITVNEAKERTFHGGVEPGTARKEIWLWLLDVHPWDSTKDERIALMNRETTISTGDQKNRIEKDVHRTDRGVPIFAGEDIPHLDPNSPFAETGTNVHLEQMKDMLLIYNEYSTDLGYVQGMGDLLAPVYAVLQDDAAAFWAFVGFKERMERNFLRDQTGMRAQPVALDHLVRLMDLKLYAHLESADSTNFFFFSRALLVWCEWEFGWGVVLRLWETMWTNFGVGNKSGRSCTPRNVTSILGI